MSMNPSLFHKRIVAARHCCYKVGERSVSCWLKVEFRSRHSSQISHTGSYACLGHVYQYRRRGKTFFASLADKAHAGKSAEESQQELLKSSSDGSDGLHIHGMWSALGHDIEQLQVVCHSYTHVAVTLNRSAGNIPFHSMYLLRTENATNETTSSGCWRVAVSSLLSCNICARTLWSSSTRWVIDTRHCMRARRPTTSDKSPAQVMIALMSYE